MDLWISALLGTILLAGVFGCNGLKKKTPSPIYKYMAVILGVLAAICFFYCTSGLLLILGID